MKNKTAAILLSRQPLGSSGSSPWVKASISAVKWIKDQGYTLLTSVGMQTWELQLFLAVNFSIPQIVVIPSTDNDDFIAQCDYYKTQLNVQQSNSCFREIKKGTEIESNIPYRDKYIIESADILIPVSIRKKGIMCKLLSTAENKITIDKFSVPFESERTPFPKEYSVDKINNDIESTANEYLFHWTRASFKPWPQENLLNYYHDISNSNFYPRNAYNTLENILKTQKIISSSRHMPLDIKCVSFTGNRPTEFLTHMRWRQRYCEMSFEPYGIGIRETIAQTIGIQKVTYTKDRMKSNHPQRWLFQSAGLKGDWQSENEYRYRGDLDLSAIDRNDLLVICETQSEAEQLSFKYGVKGVFLFKMP